MLASFLQALEGVIDGMADSAGEKPRKTDKPWGYELLFARTDKYAGKVLYIKKGHRLSLQYHQKKDETIYVYEGELRLEIEGEGGAMSSPVLRSGEGMRIKPHTRHRMEAIKDTFIFEVSTPELEDVVRLADDYGRAGKTAGNT
jgi:mannose-6-phosphate isomerase